MKIKYFLIALAVALAVPQLALAADLNLYSATTKTKVGSTFSVSVSVNPGADKLYTAKAEIKFPADLLEVKSFVFGEGLMPLQQAGYDLTDNAGGVLLKTAGFPGGLTAKKSFGTVIFKVKKLGVAEVSVGGNTMLLDAANGNKLVGSNQLTITIEAPAVVTSTNIIPKKVSNVVSGLKTDIVNAEKASDLAISVDNSEGLGEPRCSSNTLRSLMIGAIMTMIAFALGYFVGKKK